MSVMWPMRVAPASAARPACRSLIASIDPASTACSSGVSAPSRRMSANANGWSSGCCSVGVATQRPRLDGAGRARPRRSRRASSGAGVGVPLQRRARAPGRRCGSRGSAARSAPVMNAPITGPSERLYGNVIVDSVTWVTGTTCCRSAGSMQLRSWDPLSGSGGRWGPEITATGVAAQVRRSRAQTDASLPATAIGVPLIVFPGPRNVTST